MPDGSRTFDSGDADPRSLAAVYRAHSAYVWRVLRHCGVPDPDLDDAVQETFLVVFRRLEQFEARSSLRTWIYAVAVRVASTRRRSQRREARRRERAGAQMHGASNLDPEVALEKAQAAQLVDRLLEQLDEPKRTVFVLAEIEGVKVPEISRILGVNPRTVHSRLRLARERFGTALKRMQAREDGDRRTARLRPRALVRHAANDRPAASRRKAVGAAIAVRIQQGAMPQLAGWQSLTLSTSSIAWSLPVALVGGAVISWAVLGGSPDPDRDPTRAAQSVPSSAPAPSRPLGSSSTPAAPPASPAPLPGTATATPAAAPTSPPVARPTPRRSASAPPTPPSTDPPPPRLPRESASEPHLAEETRLLQRARTALRREDPAAALAAIDEHLRRFPEGVLADEARSTRLRSLCAAGRDAEATAFASRLSGGAAISRWHEIVAAACSS